MSRGSQLAPLTSTLATLASAFTCVGRPAPPAPTTPAELRSFVSAEVDRWGKAVKQAGATID